MEYVENLPESVISEYMALNSIMPFTHDAQAQRDGLIASILYNKDIVKKQHLKSGADLIPYLKEGVPEWLQDEMVIKAKNLLRSAATTVSFGSDSYERSVNLIKEKIKEEIQLERKKDKPNKFRISELEKLL